MTKPETKHPEDQQQDASTFDYTTIKATKLANSPSKIQSLLGQLRQRSKPVGQAATFALTTGTIAANSVVFSLPLWVNGAVKTLTGNKLADSLVLKIATHWIHTNNLMIDKILPNIELRVSLPDDLSQTGRYILISNHQSWVDTSVIQYVSENRLPLTRFFAKHELLYIPIVGQAFYFLDFPMMKRYSKEAIAKNPALKDRDFIEAKRACELLANKPFTLLNFVEGTRFTQKKHDLQQSPYTNLLKPKAGGIALALGALGDKIDGVLDATIVYPDGIPTYQDLWKGNIRRIGVEIRRIEMPADLLSRLLAGKYQNDEQTRADMYEWLDVLWQQKQQRIEQIKASFHQ